MEIDFVLSLHQAQLYLEQVLDKSAMFFSLRYNRLSGPLQNRRETLEAWQVLFQFYRDLEEEVAWLNDRLPSVTAKDLGSSLSSTQQLLHRHQV